MTRGLRNNNPGNIRKVEPIGRERWNLPATRIQAVRIYGVGIPRDVQMPEHLQPKIRARHHSEDDFTLGTPERERHGCIYPYGIRIVRRPGKRMDHGNQPRCDDPDSRSYVARRKWR